jgi:hypothetical protein
MNASRVPRKMHRRNDGDRVCTENEEDAVWKAVNERPPQSSIDQRKAQRLNSHCLDDGRDLIQEFPSEAVALFCVPVIGGSDVGLRIRADDETQAQLLLRILSFTSDQTDPASGSLS